MRPDFESVLHAAGAALCVECGKCVSVCPMAEMYPGFGYDLSPRGMVQKALKGRELLAEQGLWCCTLCGSCAMTCPAGVDCRGMVEGLRPLAGIEGAQEAGGSCADCGAALPPAPVLAYLRRTLPEGELHYLDLCPACRRRAYIVNNT